MKKIVCLLLLLVSSAHAEFKPKISLICSLYNGGDFITNYMEDCVNLVNFKEECELIIINAHSPDTRIEEAVILNYVKHYPDNIIYVRLPDHQPDPGLYGVWNMCIKLARGKYIMNANVDDRLAPKAAVALSQALDANPNVSLVYSACYISGGKNETFKQLHKRPIKQILDWPKFSRTMMQICLPGNHPMWRASIHHTMNLWYDDSYKAAGDWEFFLRMVEAGCIFKKVKGVWGVFYQNATGLTRNAKHAEEMDRIIKQYKYIWS